MTDEIPTACTALERFSTGELSPLGLVEDCLQRIQDGDAELQAWCHLATDSAIAAAHCLEGCAPDRATAPLRGLPVGVKDIFDTHDMPTAYGSAIFAGHRPAADASAVALLRASGAIVLGKTATTEFAAWPPARTRNPVHPGHTPGGSSSGSAAAVAAGMVPVALGTQTLGSVIRPASYCGIVGFKPSFGRIVRVGVRALAESLDTIGILAREVADCALVYRCLSGVRPVPVPEDADCPKPTIAFCRGPDWQLAAPDAREAMERYIESLRISGLAVETLDLPAEFDGLSAAARAIHDFELYRGFADERLRHQELLSESFLLGLERAARHTAPQHAAAVALGAQCRRRFAALCRDHGLDAVLCLSATGEAPEGLASTGDPVMNSSWTLLYAACVSIPLLQGVRGLPIGVQVVAPQFRDEAALRVAHDLLSRSRTGAGSTAGAGA